MSDWPYFTPFVLDDHSHIYPMKGNGSESYVAYTGWNVMLMAFTKQHFQYTVTTAIPNVGVTVVAIEDDGISGQAKMYGPFLFTTPLDGVYADVIIAAFVGKKEVQRFKLTFVTDQKFNQVPG